MKKSLFKPAAAVVLSLSFMLGQTGGAMAASKGTPDAGAETINASIVIDASTTYQTIDNFGASDAWSMDPIGKGWTEENKNRIADLLFSRDKGIGLSAWRFNIGAGSTETDQAIITNPWRRAEAFKMSEDGNYDWSKQAGQQWFLQAAKDRGVESLIAFVNSPPVWMTKNGHAQPDSTVGSTNLKEGYEDEFASFLVDVLKHFEQEGLAFDYVSPINEPTWDWNKAGQEGNRYNNDDIKRVVLALYGQLQASGSEAKISAPDGVEITALLDDEWYKSFSGGERYNSGSNQLGLGKYREYIKDLIGDPELKEAVGNKIASHSYWSDYYSEGDDRLGELRDILTANLQQYDPETIYWMTEYCILGSYGPGRDLGIDPALHVARTIHFDLARANASAWQWWTAVSKENYKDGLIYTDYNNPGDEQNILTSKMLWALGNYSKFIRPGAQRIELTGLDEEARSGLFGSAYKHEAEGTVTAVFVNDSSEDKRVELSIGGLGRKSDVFALNQYVTSKDRDLARAEDVPVGKDGTFETVIPARSVVTLNGDAVKENKKPDAPVITGVKPLHKGLEIEMEAPKGATSYEVSYGIKNKMKTLTFSRMSGDSFLLTGLENGKEYAVTVRAANPNGYGPPSKRAYGTPQLLSPMGVSAKSADGGFVVQYETGIGVPGYQVKFGTRPGVYDQAKDSSEPNGTLSVDGLVNGKTYYGVLVAVDGGATSPASPEFAVTPDIAGPSKVIAVPGDGSAHIEMTPVAGATGYELQFPSGTAAVRTSSSRVELDGLANGEPASLKAFTVGKGGIGTKYTEVVFTAAEENARLTDDFESGDLAGYSQDVSSWILEDGLLKQAPADNGRGEVTARDLYVVDGSITAIAKHATADADWGIGFRGPSYDRGYLFGFENGVLVLRRDGQNLADPVPFTAKLGELYALRVELAGKRIQAFLDGKLVFEVTDTTYTGGRVGLHSWGNAEFAYLKVARDHSSPDAAPEIYQARPSDGQVVLQFSEVDDADGYVIRYGPSTGELSSSLDVPARQGSAAVKGLQNGTAYRFTVSARLEGAELTSEAVEATPVGGSGELLYYVDAGDGSPFQLEDGETLGSLQSQEEQAYGVDPVTGGSWGYVADDGRTWAHTSPTDAYETIRQYDGNENGKGLAYRFQVPEVGTYKVTIGFYDPWQANDRSMDVAINGETVLSGYVIGTKRESQTFEGIAAPSGDLAVKVVKAGGSKPMISWIKVERQ